MGVVSTPSVDAHSNGIGSGSTKLPEPDACRPTWSHVFTSRTAGTLPRFGTSDDQHVSAALGARSLDRTRRRPKRGRPAGAISTTDTSLRFALVHADLGRYCPHATPLPFYSLPALAGRPSPQRTPHVHPVQDMTSARRHASTESQEQMSHPTTPRDGTSVTHRTAGRSTSQCR